MHILVSLLALISLTTFPSAEAAMIDNKGKLLPATCHLLKIIGQNVNKMTFDVSRGGTPTRTEVNQLLDCGFNACELRDFLQKHFLRPKGKERRSQEALRLYDGLFGALSKADKEQLLADFKALDYIEPIYPNPDHKHFTFIVIHGSLITSMRDRIMTLDKAIRDGKVIIDPNTKIIFANGYRQIWPQEIDKISDTAPYATNPNWKPDWIAADGTIIQEKEPKDEIALSRVAWAQLDLSPSLRAKTPVFLDAPKKSEQARAHTKDTMDKWLSHPELQPQPGDTCLSVSTQPFTVYQAKHVDAFLAPYHIKCELLGGGATITSYPINEALGTLFDNAARELYQTVPRIAGTCGDSGPADNTAPGEL